MKNPEFFALFIAAAMALSPSCSSNRQHIISDSKERKAMLEDFESRKQELCCTPVSGISYAGTEEITSHVPALKGGEKEAMQFLYAYMPLADIADHPAQFFLENIRTSFRARKEMPWGKEIPEREFRHFVLPIRVNNEDLDNSRMVFYEELKDRVSGLSLHDAVLEINHWCHEKVVYAPSDARTSTPLASIRTAHGRCGEESTLTVAALRAMCIPARQVYTPRWAHTDDNHAWVEAWVDGEWCFLGACEPEPVLNLAWFNAPVSRGMMMHTKVFGRYDGPEEKMRSTRVFTEINVTENYVPVARAEVRVVDKEGNPVQDATVEFKVYNYAEFYTVSKKETDSEGKTFLSAGKGDMLVWAYRNGAYGFSRLSFGKEPDITITLDRKAGDLFSESLDIIPPAARPYSPEVTPEQRKENKRRFAQEDSIRTAYIATFPDRKTCRGFALSHDLDVAQTETLIKESRGNYQEIMDFMAMLGTPELREAGLDLLQRISRKDLRDTPAAVLADHLAAELDREDETGREYVRNPRISTELLTPYRSFFHKAFLDDPDFSDVRKDTYRKDPMQLAAWVNSNIRIDTLCNLGAAPVSPAGVWKCRIADVKSRNIFFVALARSLGIPSRIDPVTGKIQVMGGKQPVDIDFGSSSKKIAPSGTLRLTYRPSKVLDDPEYFAHFTISRITPEGSIRLLNYEEGEVDMGGGTTWSRVFRKGTRMDAGDYILVTGTRLANGSVLSRISSFRIEEGKTTVTELEIREAKHEIQVIGSFDSESRFTHAESSTMKSVLDVSGRGYFAVGVLGMGQEPTNHALRDIASQKKELEEWGRTILLLFPDKEACESYLHSGFPAQMPSTVVCGIDDGSIQEKIAREMKFSDSSTLPMFIIGDTFNRVVFSSQGYTIGLGEQLMKVAHRL